MRSTVWLWALLFFIYGHAWAAEAPAAPVKRLAAIQGSSIFLDKTGTMWWWGGGDPKPAPVLRGVTAMAFGGGANFVIKDDATLWGKGNSTYGQLGFFSKKRIEQYVKIFTDVLAVASADNTVYALKKDHTLWTWGRHNSYEKGARKKPEKILDKVVQVAAAMMHTVALREDGTLWSWGSNRCGRLGAYKDIDSRSRPGKMDMEALEGRAVTGIVVCMDESYAVTEDGLVWRWGEHLPKCESMPPYASSPERLPFINNVRRIAVNEYSNYFLALKKDGSLWAWGATGSFGLPEGSWDAPRQLLDGVEEIAMEDNHALALKKDGTVWAWGNNEYGQLGPNRGRYNYTPRQVVIPDVGAKEK